MQAVTDAFGAISKIDTSPTRLIYYAAQGLTRNSDILLQSMKWSVSNNREGGGNPSEAPVSGKDLFQILEIEGKFLAIQGKLMWMSLIALKNCCLFEVEGRTDIDVVPVLVPNKELDSSNLQGSLAEGYAVDAARQRRFIVRIIWKEYDEDILKSL